MARLASFAIPAKEHSELAGISPKSFLYQGLNQKLWKIKRANPEILRIYTIVPHGGFGSYVLYAGEDPSAQYDPMLVEAFLNIYDWEGKKEEVLVGAKQ